MNGEEVKGPFRIDYHKARREIMKKIVTCAFIVVLIISLAGCGISGKKPNKEGGNNNLSPGSPGNKELTLPESYPKETLPLAADAEILDVRENPANNGIEVDYVSSNNIDTLIDFYEGLLLTATDLETSQLESGAMITAKVGDVYYTIMLNKGIMDNNPKYAGKVAVSVILSGKEQEPSLPDGDGETWPEDELPGVPQLMGYISQIQREDDIVRLEIIVGNDDAVKSYIGELRAAGFRFDAEPDPESEHIEFFAFKGNSVLNFAYKAEEQLVFIEYQK
jgi:hypothetical protein